MTPRSVPASELRPAFASPVNHELAEALKSRSEPLPEREPIPVIELEPGDLLSPPTLDQYRAASEKGPAALLRLASDFQNEGRIQRAVLAYERILDSTPPGGQERVQAEEAIASLKTSLPPWNTDAEDALPLTIHFGTARSAESFQGPITALSSLITLSSGNLCRPDFQIHPGPAPEKNLPALPVAMWLTVEGEEPQNPALAVLTIAPESEAQLDSRLTHALYRLISRRLKNDPELTAPPALLISDDPEKALVVKVTRLTWQKLLTSPFQAIPAEDGAPIGPDLEEAPATNPEDAATEMVTPPEETN
jgi:hypothetical protein